MRATRLFLAFVVAVAVGDGVFLTMVALAREWFLAGPLAVIIALQVLAGLSRAEVREHSLRISRRPLGPVLLRSAEISQIKARSLGGVWGIALVPREGRARLVPLGHN